MNRIDNNRRILLVVTERSPLQRLWDVVETQLADRPNEVVTLFVNDERWRRAASLPFTREVSRFSGSNREFTTQRAAQLDQDMVSRVRSHILKLATRTELQPMFKVLAEHEAAHIHDYVRVEEDLVIIPADLRDRPIFRELTRLTCRTLFVEPEEHGYAQPAAETP
jgi:hypothetical protein